MIHEKEPSMETKVIRPLMADSDIKEKDRQQLMEIYNRIAGMHGLIEDKKTAKRILSRTHLISIVPIVWKSLIPSTTNAWNK